MAKVDNTRNDFLQHAEDLAHLGQAWELEPVRHRNLGKKSLLPWASDAVKHGVVMSATRSNTFGQPGQCSAEAGSVDPI
ncbi:hypothetical protein PC128_g23593 [Phytophthora cactorum]|nr:hypothetical protein PC128_g23593 [Phytophthora cactorum]